MLTDQDPLRVSFDLTGAPEVVVEALREVGIEGVIAKRRQSSYQPDERSSDWLKLKLERQQEFVVGGYRPDGANGLDALLVGYYEGPGLRFAGSAYGTDTAHSARTIGKAPTPANCSVSVRQSTGCSSLQVGWRRDGRRHGRNDLEEAADRRADSLRGMD